MYIFGAGGHAKVIIDTLQFNGEKIDGIIVDDGGAENNLFDIPIYNKNIKSDLVINKLIIGIGDNKSRKAKAQEIKCTYGKAIHLKSIISVRNMIDEGTVIMAGVVINADTTIGKHVIINTSASIDHDCTIGDFVHVSPNATLAGGVTVDEGTHVGAGATVIQKIHIGKWATIGAGSVIINDVPDFAVVVGNPGKIIKYNTSLET